MRPSWDHVELPWAILGPSWGRGLWAPFAGPILGPIFGGFGAHFWSQNGVLNLTFSGSDLDHVLVPVFIEFGVHFGAQNGPKGTKMASKSGPRELS